MNPTSKRFFLLLLFVLLSVGGFWFFGSHRPTEVVISSTAGNLQAPPATCGTCNGTGVVAAPKACRDCSGSGKSEWHFRSRATARLSDSAPICITCNGTGAGPVACTACDGTGQRSTTGIPTVQSGLSPWESFLLKALRIEPDVNPKPQRVGDGDYPLIVEYIRLRSPTTPVRVAEWRDCMAVNGDWEITAVLEWPNPNGAPTLLSFVFAVRSREVAYMRRL